MSSAIKAPRVSAGETVGIVAPASPIDRESFLHGVQELERLGYKTRYNDEVFSSERYFAGSHARRIQEFQKALADPALKAIFAARGGYGSGYLTGQLTGAGEVSSKIIVGSSDLTILLLHMWKHLGWVTFYGPMVAQQLAKGTEAYDETSLRAALEGRSGWVAAEDGEVLRNGTAEGILLGGCLSLVVATLGTPDEIDTRGTLLLLEDVNSKPYQVDRMLWHLRRAGKLDEVRGIIFGQMPGCTQHPDQGYQLPDVILDLLEDFRGPIAYGIPFGHTTGRVLTLPLGVTGQLKCDRQAKLSILEAATV